MATKRYWTISEVAEQFDVNASLLRYWEKEFTALDPKKQGSGKRAYTAKDIEIIGVLHDLLKRKGYTIDGAKRQLKQALKARAKAQGQSSVFASPEVRARPVWGGYPHAAQGHCVLVAQVTNKRPWGGRRTPR